ncbi:MAG: carbohydrate ABC transporter permease [Defluviitaleaceae bacterium]|nr:carbohydrate ABC transporter permease [Defluviitaleaceae bacterium]MCL2239136.1 carbohydrate ABC transporter permease [Defluviitaleaceae bacterium]
MVRFKRKWYVKLMMAVLIMVALVWTLVPIYIVVSNAFRATLDIHQMPPQLIFKPIFIHFQRIFEFDNFGRFFRNSLVISTTTTFLSIMMGSLAAYGVKLCRSSWGRRLSNTLLLGRMVPAITILIPLFIMMNRAGLTGTRAAVILAHTSLTLPFVTWLMTGFIEGIPDELLEAANAEGCSRLMAFFRIVFPLLRPAVASAAILVMQTSWNELIFSLQLTNIRTFPLTVGVARYVGAVSVDWGRSSAAATITMVPIIIFGFLMQKYLISGMTAGAVKG